MDTNKLSQVVKAIVAQQKSIIGPMAVELANRVSGIKISKDLISVEVAGDSTEILSDLVGQYQKLFGKASVEACKDSIKSASISIPDTELPAILQ